jgi:adenosylcobinamide-GDP ribazoletransferase
VLPSDALRFVSSRPPSPSAPPAWWQELAGAWIFYSVLPAWPRVQPRFERIARFGPWIGAVLGSLQGLLWILSDGGLPPAAQVALVLACGLSLSGGIHIDGVMDTADGLAAGERALEAMDDSRVGASGVVAFAQVLLVRAAALLTLAEVAPAPLVALTLIWAAVWGRLAPLVAIEWFPYLRQTSGGSAGFHRQHWRGLGRELLPSLPLLVLLALASGPVGLGGLGALGLVPALVIPWLLGRRLGGHSGDTYGACVEWCEALALALMALMVALA